jgi:hypothetical protein
MKTLWKRLSKENRKKLKQSTTLYPTASINLINELETKVAYTDLKLKHILWLLQETTKKPITLENIDELFKK